MSKYNKKEDNKVLNEAGGISYKKSTKAEFATLLLTSFVSSQFYRDEKTVVKRISDLIYTLDDKKFAAKAAIYARTKYGMRSVSHVVAAELAKYIKGTTWAKHFYDKVIYRPDDMTEILSYYYKNNGSHEPRALIKGFAQAFAKFDAYQLGKYRGEGNEVSLIDVVNITHPKPTEKNAQALESLIKGTLKADNTVQKAFTQIGQKTETTDEQKQEMKADVWVKLITERKLGYFALLKNLRNILEQVPNIVPEACKMLVEPSLIKSSLVLPFRYVTALDELSVMSGVDSHLVKQVIVAVNQACDLSMKNVPAFEGKTLIALDGSGSMKGALWLSLETNKKNPDIIGSLFAAVLTKANPGSDLLIFSEGVSWLTLNPMDSTITLMTTIKNTMPGGGTNFHEIFNEASKAYDRIIILSDNEAWMGYEAASKTYWKYKERTGANPKLYSFDLAGYSTMQFPENDTYLLAGFSEKVFDIMKLLETDRNALITEIESINL